MTTPYVAYPAAAGQRDFDVTFPFLDRRHVQVLVNGIVAQVLEWVSAARLRLAVPCVGGETVVIQRNTAISEQLVNFRDGAVLTQEDLNKAVQQLLYKHQELEELYNGTLLRARIRLGDNLGIVTDPEKIAQELAELVLEDQVLDNFRQRIADIDLNAEAITETGLTLGTLRTDHDTLKTVVDALASVDPGEGLATMILNEQTARIEGDTALTQTLALIGARSGDNLSFIVDLNKTKVSPTESLATRFSALQASDASNLALIQSEATARTNADSSLASSINTLGTRMGTAEAAIIAESSARSTAISAEATARTQLAATLRGETSAAITAEQNVRSTADTAFANTLSLIGAKNGAGTAWVLNESTVQLSGGVSLGTRLSGIDTALGANASAIVNEQTARTTADSSLAQSISTVSSNLGGLTSSVSSLSSAVNGLSARQGISLDVNGYVTGYVQNNDGTSGSFTILADRFAVVSPGGGTPFVPFEISDGFVRIKDAIIGTLSVNKLVSGTFGADMLLNGVINVGTGRIVWNNGTFMKVTGIGFGTSHQFIEWFGPTMSISQCSEANAIQYLRIDGDAYWGGTLAAGVLKNAAQSSDLTTTSTCTVGPFGTEGNPIQAVAGWTYQATVNTTYPATTAGRNAFNADAATHNATATGGVYSGTRIETVGNSTLTLERKIGPSGSFAAVASGSTATRSTTFYGQAPVVGDSPGFATMVATSGISFTYTDNAGGILDREFRATLARGYTNGAGAHTQRVSIITTEE